MVQLCSASECLEFVITAHTKKIECEYAVKKAQEELASLEKECYILREEYLKSLDAVRGAINRLEEPRESIVSFTTNTLEK